MEIRGPKRLRFYAVAVCAMTMSRCGADRPVLLSPAVEEPVLSCPFDLEVFARRNEAPTVTFENPVGTKGLPPITVTCTPASGTSFANDTTVVRCEAIDGRAHRASCSFSVFVKPAPQLRKTSFLAFGDSLTEGKHRLGPSGIFRVPTDPGISPPIYNEGGSYPEMLNARLAARYLDQTITVTAFGRGLETAGQGNIRLRQYWPQLGADALLLLEGVNDLTDPSTATAKGMEDAINRVIDALRADITLAKQRGATVFLATLLPMKPPVDANVVTAVSTLNLRIKALAAEQAVTLVDLNAAVPVAQIGIDGIHPSPSSTAYSIMADEWMKAITQTLEVPGTR